MADTNILVDNIRQYIREVLQSNLECQNKNWPDLVDFLTKEALLEFFDDGVTRAVQSDMVEQIVVQEASKAGLDKK